MLSSKKILYLVIISLLVVCGVNGIDYRSGVYDDTGIITDEIITFSDSGFFDVPEGNFAVPVVSDDGEGNSNSADVYIPEDTTTTVETPDIITLDSDTGTTTTTTVSTTTSTTTPTVTTTSGGGGNQTTTTTTVYYVPPESTTSTRTTTTTTTTTVIYVPPATTTTTTTTTAPTTTTTRVYYDSGSVHFVYSTIRIYAGSTATVEVSFPFGTQRLASFSSKDSTIASASSYNDTTALITGMSVGTTWIQATSSSGDYAYCKVIVTDFAEEVLRLTNVERANYGLPPLTAGSQLVQTVANIRLSESMRYFSHTRPDGRKFSTAAEDVGLSYLKIGENLASGQVTPEQVVSEWMASTSHRANILDSNYTQLAVAYGIGTDGYYYWVQIFYKPM